MDDIKAVVSKNIIALRQAAGMTQYELAEKLNYSDKAVSKWERGESLPDVAVLKAISQLFGVTLDWMVESEHKAPATETETAIKKRKKKNRVAITLMSIVLVWLIATALFVILQSVPHSRELHWLSFVYALPITFIIWLVFNSVWFSVRRNFLIISLLMWSLIAALFINLAMCGIPIWQLFLVGVPGQMIILTWSSIRLSKKK